MINTYSILDQDFKPIAYGLYLGASYFDNSCCPNTAVTFDGPCIRVSLIEDVATMEGEKPSQANVFVRYLDPLEDERKERLSKLYYFDCECRLCQLQEQYYYAEARMVYKAPRGKKDYQKYVAGMDVEGAMPDLDLIDKLSVQHPVSIDPNHNANLRNTMDLKMKEANPDWETAYGTGYSFTEGIKDVYYSPSDPVLAMHALKMAKIARILEGFKDADRWLDEADAILKVVYAGEVGHEDSTTTTALPYMLKCLRDIRRENDEDLEHLRDGDVLKRPPQALGLQQLSLDDEP